MLDVPSYTKFVVELEVQLEDWEAPRFRKSGPTPFTQLLSWLKVP